MKSPKPKSKSKSKAKAAPALPRPYNRYNCFFILERERIIRAKGGATKWSSTPDDDDAAPCEGLALPRPPPLPSRFAHLTVPADWCVHASGKGKRRAHRKSHGVASFRDLARTIADSWKVVDGETFAFCSAVEKALKERHRALIEKAAAEGGPAPEEKGPEPAKKATQPVEEPGRAEPRKIEPRPTQPARAAPRRIAQAAEAPRPAAFASPPPPALPPRAPASPPRAPAAIQGGLVPAMLERAFERIAVPEAIKEAFAGDRDFFWEDGHKAEPRTEPWSTAPIRAAARRVTPQQLPRAAEAPRPAAFAPPPPALPPRAPACYAPDAVPEMIKDVFAGDRDFFGEDDRAFRGVLDGGALGGAGRPVGAAGHRARPAPARQWEGADISDDDILRMWCAAGH